MKIFFNNLFRFFLTIFLLALIVLGVYDYLKNVDTNDCSMTYMRQSPGLIPINLPKPLRTEFPYYKLFLYCEGNDCQKYENLNFNSPGHIPVLFVPGNADSHLQVRSIASVALDKSLKKKYEQRKVKFLYFTISFNEELTGMYGPLLEIQTKFVKFSIEHILSFFKNVKPDTKRPKTVVLIGNSMGGIIARSIFLPGNDNFREKQLVHTIITQSSPHNQPVINIDPQMWNYYEKANNFWLNKSETSLKNVVLASLYGGTRDFLVRSGLSDLNEWVGKSNAAIISGYTVSMPFVWRSIDHRCMSWCKELVMAENRALFEIIDPTTGQITDDRSTREKVFKHNFQGISITENWNEKNLPIKSLNIRYLKMSEIFFENSDYVDIPQLFVFNLIEIFKDDNFDSLFIYTNVNEPNFLFLCKELKEKSKEEFDCEHFNNVITSSHKEIDAKTIPPYFEGNHREASLKTVNIIDMKELIQKEKYSNLILKLPVWAKNKQKHQLIVKFDWYKISERSKTISLPKFVENTNSVEIMSKVVFQRISLPELQHVLQAYSLIKLPKNKENKCDDYLIKKMTSNNKPLSSSSLMLQFHEPLKSTLSDQSKILKHNIYHSQAIQSYSKKLLLLLTSNQNNDSKEVPYIDVLQFDLKHLIRNNPPNLNELNNLNCSSDFTLEIETNYIGILGQYIRFFILFTPCYIVIILQIYDYLILTGKLKDIDDHQSGDFFFLNRLHTLFFSHLKFSLILTFTVSVFQSEKVQNFLADNSIFLKTDFEILSSQSIWLPFIPFFLYWNAYALLSVGTFFISILFAIFSFLIGKILRVPIFKWEISQWLFSIIHLSITGFACFLSSSLVYCSIFYAEMIRLSAKTPKYSEKKLSTSIYLISQSRLVLFYLLLVLNLPSLIVWVKSLESPDIISFYGHYNSLAISVACSTTLIYIFFYLKDSFGFVKKIFNLNNAIIARLIMFNCSMTLFYSTTSIYRLEFFILLHLVLMLFNSLISEPCGKVKKE